MAYVEWHQEIHSHYKTNDLMRRLQVSRREALGILAAISAWTIGHRPGGIVERRLIAVAVEWDKDPEVLVQALLDAGWLDKFDDTKVEVHDWEEITTGYRKARKDAKRKRDERAEATKKPTKEPKKASSGRPAPVRGRKRDKTVRGLSVERRAEQTRTERTEQNRPDQTDPSSPTSSVLQQPQKPTSSGSSGGPETPEKDPGRLVVAVPEKKRTDLTRDKEPLPLPDVTERLQKQVSSRLSTPILEAIGVDGTVVEQLAKTYPAVRILHVTEHAKKQDNPGGWARAALEKGWTVPDSNGTGLAKLMAALETEMTTRDKAWERMGGGILKKDPEFERREGETTEQHLRRVDELIKQRRSEGSK